jgi:hypothetical protein
VGGRNVGRRERRRDWETGVRQRGRISEESGREREGWSKERAERKRVAESLWGRDGQKEGGGKDGREEEEWESGWTENDSEEGRYWVEYEWCRTWGNWRKERDEQGGLDGQKVLVGEGREGGNQGGATRKALQGGTGAWSKKDEGIKWEREEERERMREGEKESEGRECEGGWEGGRR